MLERRELISLPLSVWKDLLLQYYKTVNTHLLRIVLEGKIKHYDTSDEVNSFLINGNKFWLDKNTRVGLMHLANCSTDSVQLVLGD
jgi:hypothetical protein